MEKSSRQFDRAPLLAQIDYFRKKRAFSFNIFWKKIVLNLKIIKSRKQLIILRERIKHLQGSKNSKFQRFHRFQNLKKILKQKIHRFYKFLLFLLLLLLRKGLDVKYFSSIAKTLRWQPQQLQQLRQFFNNFEQLGTHQETESLFSLVSIRSFKFWVIRLVSFQ